MLGYSKHISCANSTRNSARHAVGPAISTARGESAVTRFMRPVLVVRHRSGATIDFKLSVANVAEIEPPLRAIPAQKAIFSSYGAST